MTKKPPPEPMRSRLILHKGATVALCGDCFAEFLERQPNDPNHRVRFTALMPTPHYVMFLEWLAQLGDTVVPDPPSDDGRSSIEEQTDVPR